MKPLCMDVPREADYADKLLERGGCETWIDRGWLQVGPPSKTEWYELGARVWAYTLLPSAEPWVLNLPSIGTPLV